MLLGYNTCSTMREHEIFWNDVAAKEPDGADLRMVFSEKRGFVLRDNW